VRGLSEQAHGPFAATRQLDPVGGGRRKQNMVVPLLSPATSHRQGSPDEPPTNRQGPPDEPPTNRQGSPDEPQTNRPRTANGPPTNRPRAAKGPSDGPPTRRQGRRQGTTSAERSGHAMSTRLLRGGPGGVLFLGLMLRPQEKTFAD